MKKLLKLTSLFLVFCLLLTSCAGIEEKEEITPLPQNDESWWWQNYIRDIAFDFQESYPDENPDKNWQRELTLLFTYAYKNGEAEKMENMNSVDSRVLKTTLDKLAPLVLDKPDISHIYTDYITDEEGYTYFYGNFDNRFSRSDGETDTGNWAFSVENVTYPDPLTAEVTVAASTGVKRIFTFKQNKYDYYVLKSVSADIFEKEEDDSFFENEEEKINVPHKKYNVEKLSSDLQKAVFVEGESDKIVTRDYYYGNFGFNEFKVHSPDDLLKGNESQFRIFFEEDEKEPDFKLMGEYIYSCSDKYIKKYSLSDGSLVKKVSLTDNFLEERKISDNFYPYQYIFDEELKHISYAAPNGFFLDDLEKNESYKIADDVILNNKQHMLDYVPVEIKSGKLTYCHSPLESLNEGRVFDIETKTDEGLKYDLPKPYDDLLFTNIIDDKAFAIFPFGFSSGETIEIYDMTNKNTSLIQSQDSSEMREYYFTDSKAYIYSRENADETEGSIKIYEINADEGTIGREVFSAYGNYCNVKAFGDKLFIYTYKNLFVI